MNKVFQVTKKSPIVFYGALNIGVALLNVFQRAGFNVKGFIDMCAEEIKNVQSLPVWHPDDFPATNDTIIIITTKNVFEHVSIVNHLLSNGITNFVYYPYGYGKVESQEFSQIEGAYNNIISSRYNGRLPDLDKINPIPKTTQKIMPQNSFEKYVINYDKDTYIINVPVEFIFTEILDELNNKIKVNILALPHVNLFSYFSGYNTSSVNRYLEYNKHTMLTQNFEITDKWLSSNQAARFQVYSKMQKQFVLDSDFFLNNAQSAEWDEKENYFLVNGGRHRISFLLSKGYEYIPLKINKYSLNKFKNREVLIKLNTYLKENEILSFPTPVPHPFFYEYLSKRPEYFNLVTKKILLFIYNFFYLSDGFQFPKKSVLFISEDNFSLIRYFYRIGYKCSIENQLDHKELLINQLLNIDSSRFQQNTNYHKGSYDIIYISLEDHPKVEDVIRNAFFKLLFMEVTDPLLIKNAASSRSLQYKLLGLDFLKGKPITLGVIYHEK